MTKQSSQGGFLNLAVLALISLGMLIMGFTGWYVWHTKNTAYNFKDPGTISTSKKSNKSSETPSTSRNKSSTSSTKASPQPDTPVDCTGGTNSGDTCVLTWEATDVPLAFDVLADQISPFPYAIGAPGGNGAKPLTVTCGTTGACTDHDHKTKAVVTSTKGGYITWNVNQKTIITITADKFHTATDPNDGKSRTWKFKQFMSSHYPPPDCDRENPNCNNFRAEYDFVRMN